MNWQDQAKGTLTAGGKTLEYQCFGPAPSEAPTIVLLHEGLGCLALWRDFPAALAKATGWGVFAYSRAGYGQSDPADLPRPLDYMTREALDVLPQVLDGFGFERGVLMGHSDGATIAAIYAGSVEDHRVRGLILMAPHFFTEETGLSEIAKAKTAYETTDLRDKMAKYHRDADNAFRGWNEAWLDPGFKAWHVADVIDYLRIPTLAIQGKDDQYGTLAQIQEVEERSYAPVDMLVLDDCRHAPHQDQPQAVLDGAAEFLTRLARIEKAQPDAA
ncbi:alpha/beta fold hydrolase [Tropicibacter naphthalenivorans]|uniref:Acetoin dehydrogenase E2 subunit dihydrolipoyllysine-residue acetyltransferase n=1 Tax=Tropicibacter naphthalenivorans TaxID=441103 RepID=A0A0P1GJI1_9RHOB|nr:alpha/beta hydrolase [Tropicibacter naphthalenivorans]CUH82070.1 acetoin dehydrogenase E2 subunit dihydrolipoyllysine-residue acetyltransferase [Tropicibacter naphthalenivorans]SMD08404.1 Pimeloyl-ACP methyl ester carboxylesterase [Tropicibacter naphthalenivorans]